MFLFLRLPLMKLTRKIKRIHTIQFHNGVMKMNEGYFVGWGTLALINAVLAQGKNRSGLNWFILSLFLGPLATLFLALSGKK